MQITREQVDANSFLWPDGTVPYAQFGPWPRPDCSGYVGGLCWQIPVAVSTVTLVTGGWMYEIPQADLRLGDAIGKCGPGTAGNAGHIQLFRWWTATGLAIAEQAGGPPGPRHHEIKRITPGYKAYRFRDIVDSIAPPTPPQEDDDMKLLAPQAGYGAGGVVLQYPTALGLALEILPVDGPHLAEVTAIYGQEKYVDNSGPYGTPIADLRKAWAALTGGGSGPHTHSLPVTTGPVVAP